MARRHSVGLVSPRRWLRPVRRGSWTGPTSAPRSTAAGGCARGGSAVLVLRGEAGIGKTALLGHVARQASGFRVVQVAGVEAEMELPYAGLHQLCTRMLDRLDALPTPQRDALSVALGLCVRGASRPVPVRAGRARPAVRRGRGTAAALSRRRCAVARRSLVPGARLRRAPPGRRVGGDRRRRSRARRLARLRRPARAARRRARRRRCAGPALERQPRATPRPRPRQDRGRYPRQPPGAVGAAAADERRRAEQAASRSPARTTFPGASRITTGGASTSSLRRRGSSCCSRRPTRPAT